MIAKKPGSAELLFKVTSSMGLRLSWLKQGSIFAIPAPSGERYINYSINSMNSQLSSNMVGNKNVARLFLRAILHDKSSPLAASAVKVKA